MKNHCGSHAKKCKSTSHPCCHHIGAGPVYGRQGEWTHYRQYSPLHEEGESGYNEKCENWEDVLVISEMQHAQEMKAWADRYEMLDRAYKSKARKLEHEYALAVEAGFEEAYEALREMQKHAEEKEARISALEARVLELTDLIQGCCPEKLCKRHEDVQVS